MSASVFFEQQLPPCGPGSDPVLFQVFVTAKVVCCEIRHPKLNVALSAMLSAEAASRLASAIGAAAQSVEGNS